MKPEVEPVNIGGRMRLSGNKIVWLKAEINYTQLYLANGPKLTVSYNLGLLEERLASYPLFIRPNRSTLVNLQFLRAYDENHICIKSQRFQISRRRRQLVMDVLDTPEFRKKFKPIKK